MKETNNTIIARQFDEFRTMLALVMFVFFFVGIALDTSVLAFAVLLAACALVFQLSYIVCNFLLKRK